MNYLLYLLDGFVLISSGVIWLVILISSCRMFQSGNVEKGFGDKMTKSYRLIGILVFAFSVFNIYTLQGYSLGMKIINWVAFPTLAIEFLYFGFTGIQFREKAFIWNTFVTKYEDIESYSWEAPTLLRLQRNGWIKKIRITVRSEEKIEIEEMLKKKGIRAKK